jgi:hypothetical protein
MPIGFRRICQKYREHSTGSERLQDSNRPVVPKLDPSFCHTINRSMFQLSHCLEKSQDREYWTSSGWQLLPMNLSHVFWKVQSIGFIIETIVAPTEKPYRTEWTNTNWDQAQHHTAIFCWQQSLWFIALSWTLSQYHIQFFHGELSM